MATAAKGGWHLAGLHDGAHEAVVSDHLVQAHVVVEKVRLPRLHYHLRPGASHISSAHSLHSAQRTAALVLLSDDLC